jgi:hypothetical protein
MTASVPDSRRRSVQDPNVPERSPDRIAAPTLWLASTRSAGFTGRVIHVFGYQVSLYQEMNFEQVLYGHAGMSLEDWSDRLEQTFYAPIAAANAAAAQPS